MKKSSSQEPIREKKKIPAIRRGLNNKHLSQELQTRQSELEIQNKSLIQTRAETEAAYRQYTDLYDFAPVGYFILARDGTIQQANLAGATLLGREYEELTYQHLKFFVSKKSHPVFHIFWEKLFSEKGKEICELAFEKKSNEVLWARLEATCFEGSPHCRVMLTDITERKQVEEALKASTEFATNLISAMQDGVSVLDKNGVHLDVNAALCRMTEFSREELIGSGVPHLYWPTEEYQNIQVAFEKTLAGASNNFELVFMRKSGERFPVIVSPFAIQDSLGNTISYSATIKDITERKQAEDALRENQALFSLFIQNSPIYAFIKTVTSTESRVLQASDNFQQMIGISGRDMIGKTMEELFPAESAAKFTANDWNVVSKGEVLKLDEDLNGRHYTSIKFPIMLGDKTLLAGYTIDITHQVLAEQALAAANLALQTALTREQKLAQTDVLTGINNRRHLYELAEHEFEIAIRYHKLLAVIMFDIDHFKDVNDNFGHAAGDQILQRVTQAACAELRSADVIGRYGGEEFIVILPMTNAQQAYSLAERIRRGVEAIRVPTEKGDASVTLSIGIVEMQSRPVNSIEELIRQVDAVMYLAKQDGRNRTKIDT